MKPEKTRVVVAMSGGVDSSVAAALLVEQGYEVIGMMLRLWSEPGKSSANRCCTPAALALARRVAAQLEIPFYAIDAKDVFKDRVVDYFLDGYAQGITPNPCLVCNRHIRWEFLLNKALSLEAEYMATGHYARLARKPGQPVRLLTGLDPAKDQSYVLSVLDQQQLHHALFPVGEYTKNEIRELATKFNLPVAQVKDSQDLCFLSGSDYASFLSRHNADINNPGPIQNPQGEVLGRHRGLAFYTIGQRKGLGLSGPQPLYVLDKDRANNVLIVGPADQLGTDTLTAQKANWVSGVVPPSPFPAGVKIRYQSRPARGLVTPLDSSAFTVQFDAPRRDITPGQAVVVYRGQEVAASGIIEGKDTPAAQFTPLDDIKLIHP